MAADALRAHAGVLIVGVAVAAGDAEVPAAQRELRAIVIEAHQAPAIGAMALAAVEQRAPAVRIAVARAAIRIEPRPARAVVAGGAAHRRVAAVEREHRLVVVERRHVGEFGRLVAVGAFAGKLIAVRRRVAGRTADLLLRHQLLVPRPMAIDARQLVRPFELYADPLEVVERLGLPAALVVAQLAIVVDAPAVWPQIDKRCSLSASRGNCRRRGSRGSAPARACRRARSRNHCALQRRWSTASRRAWCGSRGSRSASRTCAARGRWPRGGHRSRAAASVATVGELALVRIGVTQQARVRAFLELALLELGVAALAGGFLVLPVERKLGLVVREGRPVEPARHVAARARAEVAVLRNLVAALAGLGRAFEDAFCRVAVLAADLEVVPVEAEADLGLVVIEGAGLPRERRVALRAGAPDLRA